MELWLPPRYQAGRSRSSKTAIRCKLPVLQHGHLGKKSFFSAFSKTCSWSFSCKSFSFCRFPVLLKKPLQRIMTREPERRTESVNRLGRMCNAKRLLWLLMSNSSATIKLLIPILALPMKP